MPRADVDEVSIAYEVVGEGRPWVLTPGGRFSKDYPGVRELWSADRDFTRFPSLTVSNPLAG